MQCNTFVDLVAMLPDPRCARGRRCAWSVLLWVIGAALLSGQATPTAMSQWMWEHAEVVRSVIGERLPSCATLRRALQQLDVVEFAMQCRMPLVATSPTGLEARALDGKTVRGTGTHAHPLHVVSEVGHQRGQVVQQAAVASKSNEIPFVQQLRADRDLHGLVFTMDALHTQRVTARRIVEQGGHYLMVVKANQPDLCGAIPDWFAQPAWWGEHAEETTTVTKGHGRHEWRTLERRAVVDLPWDWPGVQQVLKRTCLTHHIRTGTQRLHVSYGITSLPWHRASAAELERLWRGHWCIENQVHYVRDVTWHEDAGQSWVGNTAQALTLVRNWLTNRLRAEKWTNVAQALRHFSAHPRLAFRFLGITT